MTHHYANQEFSKDKMARAVGVALPVSVKHSVEVCGYIRNKKVAEAKKLLDLVIEVKKAVPYRRYNQDLSHKPGIGPGRFPVKTSQEIKKLLESVEANAQFQGLNTSNLIITSMIVQKAPGAYHYGRKKRRKMKRATIEIIVTEAKADKEQPLKRSEKKTGAKKPQTPNADLKTENKAEAQA